MSRSIALIVLMSACCLVATVQTGQWYDAIYKNKNLTPEGVYNILRDNKMAPMADKYIIIFTDTSPDICLTQPYTNIYDGCIGGKKYPSDALKHYIEYCEEKRKKFCKNIVLEAEELLFDDSNKEVSCNQQLKLLAYNGDYRAQRILQMVDPEMKCEKLDEMHDLANYRLREGKRSKRLESFQQEVFESFKKDCKEYEIVMEDFRTKLETLNQKLNQTELSNLENYRQKSFKTYLKDKDQNDMIRIRVLAEWYPHRSHWLFGELFKSNIKTPTSCADVVGILGNNNLPGQFKQHHHYLDEKKLPDVYINALVKIPQKMRIEDYELRWIQKFFICRGLLGIV